MRVCRPFEPDRSYFETVMMIELPLAVKTNSKERRRIMMNTNTKKRVLAFLMALAMMVMLAACGGKNPAGTYELSKTWK